MGYSEPRKDEWKGKGALVTGASSGLGRALALELDRLGAGVVAVARGRDGLERLKREAPRIHVIPADVSRKEDIHRISGEAFALLGEIDLLVNNASALGPTPLRWLLDTECEDLGSVLETNLVGPFRLSKAVLPKMLLRGSGTVLNISSDAAINAYPRWGAYGVSKAALAHLSRIWDEELRDQGVRVLAIDPGDMDTPMHAAAVPGADPAALKKPSTAAREILARVLP